MNTLILRTCFVLLFGALLTQPVLAAHLEYVSGNGGGSYFANAVGTISVSESGYANNLSGADYALFDGGGNFSSSVGFGLLEHGFASTGFVGLSAGGGAQLSTALSVGAALQATGGGTLNNLNVGANVALTPVTLRMVGDGEATGTAVNVVFSGLAEYFNIVAQGMMGGVTMDMAVVRGRDVLGEFLWDTGDAGYGTSRPVAMSFSANVGDEIEVGAFIDSLYSMPMPFTVSAGSQTLLNAGGSLAGTFTVSSVPEPQTYALVLFGLGLINVVARGRRI